MTIELFPSHSAMSEKAADLVYATIKEGSDPLICSASGNSTIKTYQMLSDKYGVDSGSFKALTVLKLDEWGGVPLEHPCTCETFL